MKLYDSALLKQNSVNCNRDAPLIKNHGCPFENYSVYLHVVAETNLNMFVFDEEFF